MLLRGRSSWVCKIINNSLHSFWQKNEIEEKLKIDNNVLWNVYVFFFFLLFFFYFYKMTVGGLSWRSTILSYSLRNDVGYGRAVWKKHPKILSSTFIQKVHSIFEKNMKWKISFYVKKFFIKMCNKEGFKYFTRNLRCFPSKCGN